MYPFFDDTCPMNYDRNLIKCGKLSFPLQDLIILYGRKWLGNKIVYMYLNYLTKEGTQVPTFLHHSVGNTWKIIAMGNTA
jgi:Ulp1 family protease